MSILKFSGLILLFMFHLGSNAAQAQEEEKKPYRIEFKIKNLDDTVAYLGYHYGNKKYLMDTAVIDNGRALFEGVKAIKQGVYFLYTGNYLVDFIVDGSLDFTIESKKDEFYKSMEVKNSEANNQFRQFQLLMIDFQTKIKQLTETLDSTSTKSDTVLVRDQISKWTEENARNREALRQELGDGFVGQILTLMKKPAELEIEGDSLTLDQKKQQYDYYKAHFFDGLDFDSEGLIRLPSFYGKVKEYLDRVTFQNPDSIIASIDVILKKAKNNPELYRFWMGTFFQEYQNAKIMGMEKVFVYLADQYYLNGKIDWADSSMLAELKKEMVFRRENQIGLKAPQIYLLDTLERQTSLYNLKSDYLVLFFYDPDCGHCKKKTPVLRDMHAKMTDDFDVAAICVGTDIDKWKGFIKKFELGAWMHLADPHYKSNFRVQYNVRSTPQIYILDKNKQIIAKKLDVDQIESFINDRRRMDSMSQ